MARATQVTEARIPELQDLLFANLGFNFAFAHPFLLFLHSISSLLGGNVYYVIVHKSMWFSFDFYKVLSTFLTVVTKYLTKAP